MLNRAAAAAIDEQRALGLDEWTGGEYFTDNFIDHMQRVLHGFEIDKPDALRLVRLRRPGARGDRGRALGTPGARGYAAAYRRESKLPGEVHGRRPW